MSLFVLAALGAQVSAQEPALLDGPRSALGSARGLELVDGALRGAARDYKVEFRAGGFSYTCPLGKDAPRSLPFAFELESIRIGSAELARVDAPALPQKDGLRARYEHGAGVHELYDVRSDGLEQSFVVDRLPAERGELVVRGRIASELEPPAVGAHVDALEFRDGERGGVRIGAVTGIDATGLRTRGELRFDGQHVDCVLPADFVARAIAPVVVDPLIGSILTPYSAADSGDPDAAYDDLADTYLVAFERQWSGQDVDIYAQQVSGAGALVGSLMFLEPNIAPIAINPTVAYVNGTNAWFVAWQQGSSVLGPWDIAGKAVTAAGVVTSTLVIASTTDNEIDPDSWGPVQPLGPTAIVVWDAHGHGIRGAKIAVSGTPSVSLLFGFTVSTDPDDSKPAISRGGPSSALIAWQRLFAFPSPGDSDIAGLVLTSNPIGFITMTPVATLLTTVGPDERDIDVDGNGVDFALAYERRTTSDAADSDIHCLRAKYDSIANTVGVLGDPVALAADATHGEIDPAIGFLGPKYAVAWARSVSGLDFDVRMRLIDPADCTVCDGAEVTLATGPNYDGRVEIAARRAAIVGPSAVSNDQALVVWETNGTAFPFDGDIQAQQIEALAGGPIVNIGGKCGNGGTIAYGGPAAVGNPAVSITLTGADPAAAIGFINTAGPGTPVTCGACVWEPFSPLVAVRPVVGGNATYTSPVPCDPTLIGVKLRYQWTVAFTSVSPCPLSANVSLSDRLEVTYAE